MQVSPHFPLQWKTAAVKLIGKLSATEDPCSSSNFQLIALTPTIRKIFTTIMKQRLLDYIMINNNFMDKYIQKAFVPAISCCIEHHSKLAAVRFSVRKFHHSLAIAWQDIANAYGHSLIQFALSLVTASPWSSLRWFSHCIQISLHVFCHMNGPLLSYQIEIEV